MATNTFAAGFAVAHQLDFFTACDTDEVTRPTLRRSELRGGSTLKSVIGAAVIGSMLLAMTLIGVGALGPSGTPLRNAQNNAPALALTPRVALAILPADALQAVVAK